MNVLEIEQVLEDADVFTNGISGKSCNMDSYMTVIDFPKLIKAIDSITEEVDWAGVCEYWISQSYLSPILLLLGATVKRMKGLTD